uniref:Zinc finger PHD-type domain-containing protein n=1 Tax=Leersia perrieri TaxID=77586 RepID=A0A0D9W2X9_9ORYZ
MKGGRLHRIERPAGAHTTTTNTATPAPAPADDWGDGSWTVDCSCGVTFDDGEEMVSCDECSVWVHTRCARYVRSVHVSFSCHNCKAKRAPSSADEAEVAELLAELPTHRPRPIYRRWAEVPLPSRVHVHGLPGGGGTDAALFRGATPSSVFSSALWRCAGYVPKRFGFRYCEFPYWADDKDGANALFALAREKRKEKAEARFPLRLGSVHKDKNYVRTLSGSGDKVDGVERSGDDDTKRTSPPTDANKIGASISVAQADTRDNGCEQKMDLDVPDTEDKYAEMNMLNSDSHVLLQAKKKMASSSEPSGDKKRSTSKEITGTLNKYEPKESMRLVISSGVETTPAIAEQEVHSQFVKVEGSMFEGQIEGNQNVGLQAGVRSRAVLKRDGVKQSNGDIPSHAGPEKMHEGLELQKQPNQTSNLMVVSSVLDVQTNQSESLNIKSETARHDHERMEAVNDEYQSGKQGQGDTASFAILQRHSSKLASDLVSQHPLPETQNLMHTIPEHPNSNLGNVKVYTASPGPPSTPLESSCPLLSTEPSPEGTTVRLIKKDQTRLVSSADSKNDFAKNSGGSQDRTRSSEKVESKGFVTSAPKSSQASRIHVSSAKHRLIAAKEQQQKTAAEGSTPPKSLQGEATTLHSRNKAMPLSFYQRKDKIHHRSIHITQDTANSAALTELHSTETTASLSDEQLALLLHQQLNSSPRVPRVPRCHQASTMQMLHPTGASVFSKRSSAHGGRDQALVLKKRNKDDVWRDNDDTKRTGKMSCIERRHRDSSTERKLTENIESEQQNRGISSTGATNGLRKDAPIDRCISHDLPGLIEEIISRNINITYGELCDAIRQHWGDSSKPNMEDNAYPSYLHDVNDCLRNRNDWAHLVDQATVTNPNKRRKVEERDSLPADVPAAEMSKGAKRGPEDAHAESHLDILPRGKRKARKCRRLELKGRRVSDTRKRSSFDSPSDDDDAAFSDSSSDRNDTPMDKSLEDSFIAPGPGGHMEAKSADSSS